MSRIYDYYNGIDFEINSKFLLITSIIGLIINLVMIKLLHIDKSGKKVKK